MTLERAAQLAGHELEAGDELAAAARFWLKLGLVSFGGPAGQIALLHKELVQRRRWLSERRFLHALNFFQFRNRKFLLVLQNS